MWVMLILQSQAHNAICDAMLRHVWCHRGSPYQMRDADVMTKPLLQQMAEEGAAWEPPSKASITCAVVLPGMIIVATAQPHRLTALALNQPGSPSVRCEGRDPASCISSELLCCCLKTAASW